MNDPEKFKRAKDLALHTAYKLQSGRWIWCMVAAFVFVWMVTTGQVPWQDVERIVFLIVGFYFGSKTREDVT